MRQATLERIGNKFFSIALDEATDISTKKVMVTMLRYFDDQEGSVKVVMYKLDEVPLADAQNLFDVINNLSSSQLVSATTDGANVMVGAHNSVTSR